MHDKVLDAGVEPTLNEYYEPSAAQKKYKLLFMARWSGVDWLGCS